MVPIIAKEGFAGWHGKTCEHCDYDGGPRKPPPDDFVDGFQVFERQPRTVERKRTFLRGTSFAPYAPRPQRIAWNRIRVLESGSLFFFDVEYIPLGVTGALSFVSPRRSVYELCTSDGLSCPFCPSRPF